MPVRASPVPSVVGGSFVVKFFRPTGKSASGRCRCGWPGKSLSHQIHYRIWNKTSTPPRGSPRGGGMSCVSVPSMWPSV